MRPGRRPPSARPPAGARRSTSWRQPTRDDGCGQPSDGGDARTAQGPGARCAAPGPWAGGPGFPGSRQRVRLAGTAVGSAGLAVRARVTRADALAGVALRAAVVLLRGALLAGAGCSTALSAVALAESATSATCFSALAAALEAFAAVFCAIEVTSS